MASATAEGTTSNTVSSCPAWECSRPSSCTPLERTAGGVSGALVGVAAASAVPLALAVGAGVVVGVGVVARPVAVARPIAVARPVAVAITTGSVAVAITTGSVAVSTCPVSVARGAFRRSVGRGCGLQARRAAEVVVRPIAAAACEPEPHSQ